MEQELITLHEYLQIFTTPVFVFVFCFLFFVFLLISVLHDHLLSVLCFIHYCLSFCYSFGIFKLLLLSLLWDVELGIESLQETVYFYHN